MPMRILGIDPGTKCGWAVLKDGKRVASGVWNLAPRRHEGGGMRFVRLVVYLKEIEALEIDAVGYEEVRRHMGVDAAHIYGGIVATIQTWCESAKPQRPYLGIPVATAKKVATGKGNAKKEAMVAAAVGRFGVAPADDNEADALFIALALAEELKRATFAGKVA
jgi:crossover junction endodeoxyribonuclease RuvC